MGFIFIVFVAVLAACVGAVAHGRGRSGIGYFGLSLVLSPVLGIIIVLVLPDLNKVAADREAERERRIADEAAHIATIRALQPPQSVAQIASQPASVAEELTKLAELRDRGLLTPEEFIAQKTRLLAAA